MWSGAPMTVEGPANDASVNNRAGGTGGCADARFGGYRGGCRRADAFGVVGDRSDPPWMVYIGRGHAMALAGNIARTRRISRRASTVPAPVSPRPPRPNHPHYSTRSYHPTRPNRRDEQSGAAA